MSVQFAYGRAAAVHAVFHYALHAVACVLQSLFFKFCAEQPQQRAPHSPESMVGRLPVRFGHRAHHIFYHQQILHLRHLRHHDAARAQIAHLAFVAPVAVHDAAGRKMVEIRKVVETAHSLYHLVAAPQ